MLEGLGQALRHMSPGSKQPSRPDEPLRGYRALLLHCRPFLLGLGRYPVELAAKVDKFPLELLRELLALGLGSDRPA